MRERFFGSSWEPLKVLGKMSSQDVPVVAVKLLQEAKSLSMNPWERNPSRFNIDLYRILQFVPVNQEWTAPVLEVWFPANLVIWSFSEWLHSTTALSCKYLFKETLFPPKSKTLWIQLQSVCACEKKCLRIKAKVCSWAWQFTCLHCEETVGLLKGGSSFSASS